MQYLCGRRTPKILKYLFELHRASVDPYVRQFFGPWDDAIQWDFFERWFRPNDVSVIVVEDDDVGALGLESRGNEVHVTRIEVDPDLQNRGIATAVVIEESL